MTKLLAVETGMCSVGFLLTLLFFEGHCKSIEVEASEGVETEAESGLFGWAELRDQLGDVLRNRDLILLVCVFGAEIGVFYSISTVIGQIAENANYTSSQGGTLGVLLVAVGLIGAILSGMIADKLGNKHWYLIQTFGVLQFLSLLWFALRLAPGRYEEMIICCCVLGFVQTPLLGLTVDLAVEVGYPVPEIVVATVLFLSPIVISVPLVLGPGSYLPGSVFIYMCMGLVLVSVLAMFTFRGNYNRRMAESSSGAATDPSSERLLPRA